VLRRQAELKALEAKVAHVQAALEAAVPDGASMGKGPRSSPGLRFDHTRRQAWFQGQLLELRPREYDLLHFLARHRGQVFTREALLSHVWGHESYIEERTVDVHVRRLRSKLAAIAPDAQVILTEWGVGYWLAEDV
jgi:DNA-binding response OmpR family regulator